MGGGFVPKKKNDFYSIHRETAIAGSLILCLSPHPSVIKKKTKNRIDSSSFLSSCLVRRSPPSTHLLPLPLAMNRSTHVPSLPPSSQIAHMRHLHPDAAAWMWPQRQRLLRRRIQYRWWHCRADSARIWRRWWLRQVHLVILQMEVEATGGCDAISGGGGCTSVRWWRQTINLCSW